MRPNGVFAKVFTFIFAIFMLAPIVVVIGVAFTPTGFLEFPPSGLSLRWFRAILDNPEFITAASWASPRPALPHWWRCRQRLPSGVVVFGGGIPCRLCSCHR